MRWRTLRTELRTLLKMMSPTRSNRLVSPPETIGMPDGRCSRINQSDCTENGAATSGVTSYADRPMRNTARETVTMD